MCVWIGRIERGGDGETNTCQYIRVPCFDSLIDCAEYPSSPGSSLEKVQEKEGDSESFGQT